MNRRTEIIEGLRAFLTGLGQSNRSGLDSIAVYERWSDLASREIERRALAMLSGLSDDDLAAIARKEIDLSAIAKQVQADMDLQDEGAVRLVLSRAAKREIVEIARVHLLIDTLEERKSDGLDFRNVAVWQVSAALEAAYLAGMMDYHRKRG